MPAMKPVMSLASRDLKKEPWPQSWKMMKVRTSKPPARIASGSVSHHDTATLRYIKYQTSAYDPNELTICQLARHVEGF